MKIVTIIQARMSSTRLPGKVMLPLAGKPLLQRMTERVLKSEFAGTVVVATTLEKVDDQIVQLCKQEQFHCFRGDSTNLLDRHYQAALEFGADVVLKVPSDCPLIDPKIIDRVIGFYRNNAGDYDYVSNLHPASYPDGNDVELMTFPALERAWKNSVKQLEKEHTTPYIWENQDHFRIGNVLWETERDLSKTCRLTIDYQEDYELIKKIFEHLYPQDPEFSLNDILSLLEQQPDLMKVNEKYAGEYWYKNHINELKTITYKQSEII